jgi:hypothetical protein
MQKPFLRHPTGRARLPSPAAGPAAPQALACRPARLGGPAGAAHRRRMG